MDGKVYSIVIPVYNSVESLPILAERIEKVFSGMADADFETIFVDDKSPDPATWPALEKLARENEKVKAILLTRNFGQQAATLCGLREAKGDYVITMDDDLQHAPEDIPKLIEKRDHDIVVGEFASKRHGIFKSVSSRMKGWFDHRLIGKPKHIHLSSLRLFNRKVVDGINSIRTPYPFIPAMMFHVSRDVVGVEATHGKRRFGKTGYTFRKMVGVFSNLLINNSSFLLHIIGNMGIAISCFAVLAAIVLTVRKIAFKTTVTGWTSIIVTLLIIGGMILFALGIIGEYLIRIVNAVEKKPMYFIREKRGEEVE